MRLTCRNRESEDFMSDQSQTLCERAKAGDLEAASALVTQHYQRLFGWFRRLCGHDEEAEDLTQKTFCKVWAALDTFQARSSFSTWIHGIGYHVYLDWRRRGNPAAQPDEGWWLACPDDSPSPFENAAEREQAHQLYALVDQLDEETRQTVHIHYYQGLSLAETAAVLGIATSTVKYRLREAIEFLKARTAEPHVRTR